MFVDTCVWAEDPDAPVSVYAEHDQRAAAWTYVRTPGADTELADPMRRAIIAWADERRAIAARRAFRFGTNPWTPVGWSFATVPDVIPVVKAWLLTGDDSYHDLIVDTVGWVSGLNPLGMTWVTGLGARHPDNLLHIDSLDDAHPGTRPGLVPSGPHRETESGGMRGFGLRAFHPPVADWPLAERWQDVPWDPPGNEPLAAYSATLAVAFSLLMPAAQPVAQPPGGDAGPGLDAGRGGDAAPRSPGDAGEADARQLWEGDAADAPGPATSSSGRSKEGCACDVAGAPPGWLRGVLVRRR